MTVRISNWECIAGRPGEHELAAMVAYVAEHFDETLAQSDLDPLTHAMPFPVIEADATLYLSLSPSARRVAIVDVDYWHDIDPEWN